MFSSKFIADIKAAYPESKEMHKLAEEGNSFLGRWLDDSVQSITSQEVLDAASLEELKEKARRIKMQADLYADFCSGRCYCEDKRRSKMCPRLYAQGANDTAALDAFFCVGVSFIPNCPKFDTEECWKRFDELGLTMK